MGSRRPNVQDTTVSDGKEIKGTKQDMYIWNLLGFVVKDRPVRHRQYNA